MGIPFPVTAELFDPDWASLLLSFIIFIPHWVDAEFRAIFVFLILLLPNKYFETFYLSCIDYNWTLLWNIFPVGTISPEVFAIP